MKKRHYSFTLMEVIIVVIIIAILVGMGVPFYMKAAERTKTKDAIAQLKLIQEAEEMRYLELNQYVPCTDNADCNQKLFLDLRTTNPDWNYAVTSTDTSANFNATAQRTGGSWSSCQFDVDETGDPGISSGANTCP